MTSVPDEAAPHPVAHRRPVLRLRPALPRAAARSRRGAIPDAIALHGYVLDGAGRPGAGRHPGVLAGRTRTARSPGRRARCAATPTTGGYPRPQRHGLHRVRPGRHRRRRALRALHTAAGRPRALPRTSACACSRAGCCTTCSPVSTCGRAALADPLLAPCRTRAARDAARAPRKARTARTVSTSAFRAKAKRSSWSSSDTRRSWRRSRRRAALPRPGGLPRRVGHLATRRSCAALLDAEAGADPGAGRPGPGARGRGGRR